MVTMHVVTTSQLAPQVVLAAGYDFSARRADVFPAVSTDLLQVHDLNPPSADVTEGTPAGIGVNWERCRYDWGSEGVVTATVIDSNVYRPGNSRWELHATPDAAGSRIEMIWVRQFRSGPRGLIFGTLFRLFGKPIFNRYGKQVVRNLETLAIAGR
jgi:hypothetical protein